MPAGGTEEANFGLASYPATVEFDNRRIATRLRGWQWHSFCKTQYASKYGLENFIKGHTNVVRLLDSAKGLGILRSVNDESDYWEHRNLEALAKTVGEWNEMVAAFVGKLDDQLRSGNGSVAPIKDFPDYEHLEARGRGDN